MHKIEICKGASMNKREVMQKFRLQERVRIRWGLDRG
jgi:hypothetical protein